MSFFSRTFSADTRTSYSLDTPCFRVRIEPFDKATYRSTVEIAELESLTVALLYNASAVIERMMDHIDDSDAKQFAIMYVVDGEMMLINNRGTTLLKRGQFILLDNSHARKIIVYKSVKILVLYVTRPLLQRYIPVLEDVLAQVLEIQSDDIGLSPFSPVLELWERLKDGELKEIPVGITNQLLSDVGEVYAKQTAVRQHSKHTLRLRAIIKQYVETNLSNPELTAELIASEFKISSRYVRRLFTGGERLPLYIQRRRIEEAAKLLAGIQYQALSITDIAHRCGFKSSSQLARCFRTHLHETPREFRQRHILLWKKSKSIPTKKRG